MNAIDQSNLMKLLFYLKSMANEDRTHVKASIYNYAQEYIARNYGIVPGYLSYLSKVELELGVYVEKSSDNTSNITPEVMEIFYGLPIVH